ncbi:MAG: YqgE/AlgH family protein [Holophagales bacterium]|nr:YqgE/AlgH family protein [Holophagales bacterium]
MSADATLETPVFLLAMPQVLDPFFRRSVVLLIRHEEDGSLGFIVNRPTELKIADILEDLEVEWQGDDESCAFFGGPVSPEMGTLVFLDPTAEDDDAISPGVSMSQSMADLEAVSNMRPESYRLFLGYAGWGEGQLEQEILRNDWLIAPVDRDLIFSGSTDQVWRAALESVGINPDQLPAWTQGSDQGFN